MIIPNYDDIYLAASTTTTTITVPLTTSSTYDSFDSKLFDLASEIDFSNLEHTHTTSNSPQPILQQPLPSYTFLETINQSNEQFQFSQTDSFELPVSLANDTYDFEQTRPNVITDDYSLSPLSLALSPSSSSSSSSSSTSYSPKSYSLMNPVRNYTFNIDFTCLENCFSNQDLNYDNNTYTISTSTTNNNESYTISSDLNQQQSISNFDYQPYLIEVQTVQTQLNDTTNTSTTTTSDPIELINLDETQSNSSPILDQQPSPIIIDDDLTNTIQNQPYVINKPSEDLKKKCKEHLIELDRQKRTRKCSHLWQFCACLLDDETYNPSLIKWLNIEEGIFKIVEPDRVAELWGAQKTRRLDKKMTYEKMARGMRYSRSEGFFKKLDKQKNKPNEYGKQFVFQFSDKVVKNFVWKSNLFPKE